MSCKLGIKAKLYYNDGTYESPDWVELSLVSDLTVNPTWDESEANDRSSRIKRSAKTLLGLEISGMLKKKPLDDGYELMMNAMVGDDVLDLLILDGQNDTEGVRGWRCDFQVFSASEDQGLSTVIYEAFTLKPTCSDHTPYAVRVAAGPTLEYHSGGGEGEAGFDPSP